MYIIQLHERGNNEKKRVFIIALIIQLIKIYAKRVHYIQYAILACN